MKNAVQQLIAVLLLTVFHTGATSQDTLPILVTAEVVHVAEPVIGEHTFKIEKAITGVGKFRAIDDMLLVAEDAQPTMANVGILNLTGEFDASTIVAEDVERNAVSTRKISEREWLIEGKGRIIVIATVATKEPFALESKRYDVFIPSLVPEPEPEPPKPDEPVEPDKPDEPAPAPTVPEDRFGNLGQRVSALAKDLTRKEEVAANYRQFAEQLKGSIEVAEVSRAMVARRDAILVGARDQWKPVLTLVASDFTTRRPEMVRADVVEHWLAIANGLDPIKESQ